MRWQSIDGLWFDEIMPLSPKKPCRKYGCKLFQEKEGYCLDHWIPRSKRQKPSKHDRRYDTIAWQRTRALKKRRFPVCEICLKKLADTVHHIIPVDDGGDFWDPGNHQSVCRECHEKIHGR